MFSSPSSSCLRLRRKSGNGQLIIYTLSLPRVWTALQDCILDILFSLRARFSLSRERVNHGRLLPCYSNQGPSFLASLILFELRRSSLFLKLALVALHLVFIGFLLVCHAQFVEKTRLHPCTHMSSYFFLFSVTLLQYFVTCGSSPGYVIDAMRGVDETNAIMYRYAPTTSFRHASRKNWERSYYCRRRISLRCQKIVLDLYPPGTSLRNLTCGYCHVEQVVHL